MKCPKCNKSDEVVTRPDGTKHCLDCGERVAPGPSNIGSGCRVRIVSASTYKDRYGTVVAENGMPSRWFVTIDDDEQFAEVSFYAWELEPIDVT